MIVDGGRIVAAGPPLRHAGAAQVVECPGGTIVPGVIDMHAHVGFMMTGPRTPHVEIADPPRQRMACRLRHRGAPGTRRRGRPWKRGVGLDLLVITVLEHYNYLRQVSDASLRARPRLDRDQRLKQGNQRRRRQLAQALGHRREALRSEPGHHAVNGPAPPPSVPARARPQGLSGPRR
ncbi:hypothetical protein [Sphaerimonospora mesophila]|uniref:hypothetical protein n=1 Tax=Sphaerimonospora mesophila TaxID=37483 RepID=UPI00128EE79B